MTETQLDCGITPLKETFSNFVQISASSFSFIFHIRQSFDVFDEDKRKKDQCVFSVSAT